MKEIFEQITSPTWWVTVVIVGILINLASAYLKDPTDRIASRFSSARREQSAKRLNQRKEKIEYLASNPSEIPIAAMQEIRYRIRAMFAFIGLLGFFAIGLAGFKNSEDPKVGGVGVISSTAFLMGFACCTLGVHFQGRAVSIERIVIEARKSKYDDYS